MSADAPLSRVVVVGRDADLWLSLNALSGALTCVGVQVVAVELPTRLKASLVSATLPPLEAFHTKLGLKESTLLRVTAGSFSFGQNVVDLSGNVPNFFHAWGAYGAPIEGSAFFPCWLKARRLGLNRSFQHFCLTAIASQNGRMLLPDEATAALGRTDYGYHLHTMAYVAYLKSIAVSLGIRLYEAQHVGVERRDDGSISAVSIDRSVSLVGDLIVDVEIHSLQLGLVHLLALFPVSARFTAERAEYNRIMRSYYERIRDFQCAFYALSPVEGNFWEKARGLSLPAALAHKIATFRARGEIAPMEDETFLPESC